MQGLPDAFDKLTNLEMLIISNNQITSLPDSLLKLKNLKVLAMLQNPLSKEEIERVKNALPGTDIRY